MARLQHTLLRKNDIELIDDVRAVALQSPQALLALDEIQRRLHSLRLSDLERSEILAAPYIDLHPIPAMWEAT